MTCTSLDLTVDEALADPVIGAAMRADHVDPRRLETMLRSTARSLAAAQAPARMPLAALACCVRGTIGGALRPW